MKKVFFAMATLVVMGLGSCSECVDCSSVNGGGKICKSDYDSAGTGISWSTYRASLVAAGCK